MTINANQPLGNTRKALMLPHHGIDGQVTVSQRSMEPLFAISPICSECFNKKLTHSMAHILLQVASLLQLAHGSIHQGVSCSTLFPSGHARIFRFDSPLQLVESRSLRSLGQVLP